MLLNSIRMPVLASLLAAVLSLSHLTVQPASLATVIHISAEVRRIIGRLRQIDIPLTYRRANWTGKRGQGSCVHASIRHLLHWQGEHELAEWWGRQHGDGETPDGLTQKLNKANIRFAETRTGDESFLEWAIRTRRGAAVVVQNGAHMVVLCGLDRQHAHILDSNSPRQVQAWPRQEFLGDWKRSGGWAVTPLGAPAAPDPWQTKDGNTVRPGI